MAMRKYDLDVKLEYIYELYKLSAINTRYYGWRLARTQRLSMVFEIIIALGATGTGAAGLKALLTTGNLKEFFEEIWIFLAIISAILAITKPIVQLNKRVETYTKLFTGHNAGYFALKDIVVGVGTYHNLTAEQERQFTSIKNRYRELATLDEPSPNRRKIEQIRIQVNKRLPDDTFWWFRNRPNDPQIRQGSEVSDTDKTGVTEVFDKTASASPSFLHTIAIKPKI
jgi:hypothetical protein